MLGSRRQCRYMPLCGTIKDPKCADYGGRVSEKGRRADCYKDNSLFYKAVGFLGSPFRRATGALCRRVCKGLEHLGGIDDD